MNAIEMSKREYVAVYFLPNIKGMHREIYKLEDLLIDDNTELTYALQDRLDEILDLAVGQSLHFEPERGEKGSAGIINRLN